MKDSNRNLKIFLITVSASFVFMLLLLFISPRLNAQSEDKERQQQLALFLSVFEYIQKTYVDEDKVTSEILIEGAMKGMMEALDDPYSIYLSLEDLKKMTETTSGRFGGVGLYILEVEEGIEVARPIPGTPAYKAGISAMDIIIGVDDVSVVDMDIDDVIDLLKGDPGTSVKMTVLRGKSTVLDFTVNRDTIVIPTVSKDMILGETGYLKINQFTAATLAQVSEALDYFKKENYKSLIVDLRSNPGGLLDSVVNVSDLFLPEKKLIVSTKSRIPEENEELYSKHSPVVPGDIPIVILIDRYSASASEIFTGVMKDYNRAVIVGETSYGKGSVQQIHYLGGAGIKITMAKYYTPSGVTINEVGVKPHVEVIEEDFSDTDREELNLIFKEDRISNFVKKHLDPSEKVVDEYIQSLRTEGIQLDERYLKRLIRNEVERFNNDPPVYDLDYDIVLQKGLWIVRQGVMDQYLNQGDDDANKKN